MAEGGQTPPASSHAGPPAADNGRQRQDLLIMLREQRRDEERQSTWQKVPAQDLCKEVGSKMNFEKRLMAAGKSIVTALYHITAKTLWLIVGKRSQREVL